MTEILKKNSGQKKKKCVEGVRGVNEKKKLGKDKKKKCCSCAAWKAKIAQRTENTGGRY